MVTVGRLVVGADGGGEPSVRQVEMEAGWKDEGKSGGNAQSGGDPVQSLRVCVWGSAALKEHRGGTGEGVRVHV